MVLPPLPVAITWTWPTSRVRSLSPSHRRGVWTGSWTGVGSRNGTETSTSKSTGQPPIHRYYTLRKPIGPDYKMVRNVNHERNKTYMYYHKLGTIGFTKIFAGEMDYKIIWNKFSNAKHLHIFSLSTLKHTKFKHYKYFEYKLFQYKKFSVSIHYLFLVHIEPEISNEIHAQWRRYTSREKHLCKYCMLSVMPGIMESFVASKAFSFSLLAKN